MSCKNIPLTLLTESLWGERECMLIIFLGVKYLSGSLFKLITYMKMCCQHAMVKSKEQEWRPKTEEWSGNTKIQQSWFWWMLNSLYFFSTSVFRPEERVYHVSNRWANCRCGLKIRWIWYVARGRKHFHRCLSVHMVRGVEEGQGWCGPPNQAVPIPSAEFHFVSEIKINVFFGLTVFIGRYTGPHGPSNFPTAQAHCGSLGQKLMTIDSPEEEDHVTSVLNPTFQYVWLCFTVFWHTLSLVITTATWFDICYSVLLSFSRGTFCRLAE